MKIRLIQGMNPLKRRVRTALSAVHKILTMEFNRLALWIFLLSACTYLASFAGIYFLPNTHILESNVTVEIFSVVIGALASIIGIVLAFLIATFEMNKRYLNSSYAGNLFKKEPLRSLIVLFISTILLATSGLLTISHDPSLLASNISVVTLYLFTLCILSLIPRIRALISDTNTDKEVIRIIDKFVSNVSPDYYRLNYRAADSLVEISKKASKEGDESLISLIVDELNNRFEIASESLTPGETFSPGFQSGPRDFATGFSSIFYVIGKNCLSNHQLNITAFASESILHIMNRYTEKQQLYYNLVETEEYYYKLLKAIIKYGNDELANRNIYRLEQYFEYQLKLNTPPAEKLWDFEKFDKEKYDKDNTRYDLSNHWNHISHTNPCKLSELVEFAIESRNENAMQTLLRSIQSLNSAIAEMKEISEEHISKALRHNNWVLARSYQQALKSPLVTPDNTFIMFMLNPYFNIKKIIETEQPYSVWNLQMICNIFYTAAKLGKLNAAELNNIGTAGRGLKRLIKTNPLAEQSVIYIVYVLGKIKDVVQEEVDSNIRAAEIYVACYEQARSIQKWDAETVKKSSVTRKLNALIKEYTKLDDAKATAKSDVINFWQDLYPDS